jgi:hypothetical protein
MNIDILKNNFSASSANDTEFKDTWILSASLFIPQINKLIVNFQPTIQDINNFENKESKILGELFKKYGSDKSTTHNYFIFYSYILNTLGIKNKLNVLEIGLGTNNPNLVSTMGSSGMPGASLRAFRDYLPNSNIYGADIDKDILFSENRINTCYVDQLKYTSFDDIKNNFGNIKYNLIIDDGLHSIGANLNTLIFSLNSINNGGYIIIEDIPQSFLENWRIVDFILSKNNNFKTTLIKAKQSYLYVIKKVKDDNINIRENYTDKYRDNTSKKNAINIPLIVIISLLIISIFVLIYFITKNYF